MEKLFLNNTQIKTINGLINFIKKFDGENILINDNEISLFNLLDITDENVKPSELVNLFMKNRKNIRSIIKYISNNKNNLDIERMRKFIDYRSKYSNVSNTKDFLTLMYGYDIGMEKFKKEQNKFSKYYYINYYLGLGFTEEESLEKISET
jgi:hypothetical protein